MAEIKVDELTRRIAAGDTLQAIAGDCGVSRATIHARVSRLNIPRNPPGARRRLPPVEALLAAVAAGEMLKDIGAGYGVTGEAVSDALKRAGYRRVGGAYQKIDGQKF